MDFKKYYFSENRNIYLFILKFSLCITVVHSSEIIVDNEFKRNRRTTGNSCAIPSPSHDKTITYRCDGKESQTCGTEEGYIPEYTIALIKCKLNYYPEGKTQSFSTCFKSNWRPPIDNCVKQCEKLTPVNIDLQCYRKGANIPCETNSTLLIGTKIQPTCKLLHKNINKTPTYKELTCKDDGKWNGTLLSCTPECGKPYTDPAHLIAGGVEERFGDSPWNVAIYYNRNKLLICGGTIISLELVVSAAHCFHDRTNKPPNPSDYEVVVSKFTRNYTIIDNDNQKTFKIKEIRYSKKGYVGLANDFAADIALLILQEKITVSPTVLPACVDWTGLNVTKFPPEDTPAKVVGWGMNEYHQYSENLITADLPFISRERCLSIVPDGFKTYITFDKFCAGSETGATVLQGDSGGGLFFRTGSFYYLRGIVSLKQPSLTPIAAFTDIADHIEWIIEVRNEVEQGSIKAALSRLQALHNDMKSSGQEDVMKLYDLSERLKKEIIDDEKITNSLRSEAQSFNNTLRKSMQKLAVEKISDAFLNDRLSTVSQLGSDLVNTCYRCFNQIIEKVIDTVLDKLGTKEFLVMVRKPNGFCCIPELISIYTAVFYKLQRNGEINTNSIIQLAHLIKEITEWENYANVESSVRSQMEQIKDKLPKSVKNIVFSPKICIKNVAYNEYLYAAGSHYVRDEDRRYVFTWKGGDRDDPDEPGKFAWKLERDGDDYEIINFQYNEHLYAGGYNKGNDRRGVLTWRKGGAVIQSSWQFEPNGDYVYIKNINHNEYMFGDSHEVRDGTRRYVFTFIPRLKTYDSKWEIVDCINQ